MKTPLKILGGLLVVATLGYVAAQTVAKLAGDQTPWGAAVNGVQISVRLQTVSDTGDLNYVPIKMRVRVVGNQPVEYHYRGPASSAVFFTQDEDGKHVKLELDENKDGKFHGTGGSFFGTTLAPGTDDYDDISVPLELAKKVRGELWIQPAFVTLPGYQGFGPLSNPISQAEIEAYLKTVAAAKLAAPATAARGGNVTNATAALRVLPALTGNNGTSTGNLAWGKVSHGVQLAVDLPVARTPEDLHALAASQMFGAMVYLQVVGSQAIDWPNYNKLSGVKLYTTDQQGKRTDLTELFGIGPMGGAQPVKPGETVSRKLLEPLFFIQGTANITAAVTLLDHGVPFEVESPPISRDQIKAVLAAIAAAPPSRPSPQAVKDLTHALAKIPVSPAVNGVVVSLEIPELEDPPSWLGRMSPSDTVSLFVDAHVVGSSARIWQATNPPGGVSFNLQDGANRKSGLSLGPVHGFSRNEQLEPGSSSNQIIEVPLGTLMQMSGNLSAVFSFLDENGANPFTVTSPAVDMQKIKAVLQYYSASAGGTIKAPAPDSVSSSATSGMAPSDSEAAAKP